MYRWRLMLLLGLAIGAHLLAVFRPSITPASHSTATKKADWTKRSPLHPLSRMMSNMDTSHPQIPNNIGNQSLLEDRGEINKQFRILLDVAMTADWNDTGRQMEGGDDLGVSGNEGVNTGPKPSEDVQVQALSNERDKGDKGGGDVNEQRFTGKAGKIAMTISKFNDIGSHQNETTVRIYRPPFPNESEVRKLFQLEDVSLETYQMDAKLAQEQSFLTVLNVAPRKCILKEYASLGHQTVSIIIPFYNELWAVLVRTLHSIWLNSNPRYIHEIILVDDASDVENLKTPLDKLVAFSPRTRLLRLDTRVGLMRARVQGAKISTGNILIFLDAHVLCTMGWLEPLLDIVAQNRTVVAVPSIQAVSPYDFEMYASSMPTAGTFTWDLEYAWVVRPQPFEEVVDPYPTAVMIGCAFVIDRDFFFEQGSFDSHMNVWGGENLEISFRMWMCGGSVVTVPCSQMAHLFRTYLPYLRNADEVYKNLQRVADVWLDEYSPIYYIVTGRNNSLTSDEDRRGIQERKSLREKLKCHSFDWFLKNIAPEVLPPQKDSLLFGYLRNIATQLCLTLDENNDIRLNRCDLVTQKMVFSYNSQSNLMSPVSGLCLGAEMALTVAEPAAILAVGECTIQDISIQWTYTPVAANQQVHPQVLRRPLGIFRPGISPGLCLESGGTAVSLRACVLGETTQQWQFQFRVPAAGS